MRMNRDDGEFNPDEHMPLGEVEEALEHPNDWALRTDRLPHIWCPGCGIGASMGAFVQALKESAIDLNKLSVVSGIGCTGRVAGYMNCDAFHTTHGRAIPFAVGLHVANPELKVVVFSGDGDLLAIGGNHILHAARRNMDLTVIMVNNLNYGMTGGQGGPTSQRGSKTATAPYGHVEYPFNVPRLLAAAGATYVARYTILDLGRIRRAMVEAVEHKGFSVVEILSPCPIYYGRKNKVADGLAQLKIYKEKTTVKDFAPLEEAALTERSDEIVVGKFVQIEKPTFVDLVRAEIDSKFMATV